MKNFALILILAFFSCSNEVPTPQDEDKSIWGVSFVSPSQPFPADDFDAVKEANIDWVALLPYGFAYKNSPEINFDSEWQWWGETVEGISQMTDDAQEKGLSILMKPQVWIPGSWVGEMDFDNEEDWLKWEEDYESFIMTFLDVAIEKNVEMFCVGTEYKIAVQKRLTFWQNLIAKIREKYDGELVYAANWDNIENVELWADVDYIGVDAYFRLCDKKTPPVSEIVEGWQQPLQQIQDLHVLYNKPVLLTEIGYMSIDYTAWENWNNEANMDNLDVNFEGQANAYEALFEVMSEVDWVHGGFLWKWYHQVGENQRLKDYTPQNKPALEVIKNHLGNDE